MISLSCPQCGKKLKVRDELVGKKVRCPQCKQPLEIPCPDDATVPPQHRPERREDAQPVQHAEDDLAPASEPTEIMKAAGCSFEVSGEIARGGMGAIMRAVDQDIHREVAVKVLLDHADSRLKARFVEEAQITGQLEHPNIVPIHQLGVHEDGRCFFSMKMVKGRSLAQILKQGEPGASATGDEYSLGRLLNILVSICNALAYAHSRQVIHRDLKPANIMVGDFGEVYVMDWGLAKVLDKAEPSAPSTSTTHVQRKKSLADATQSRKPSDSSSGERVTTHRLIEGDLTQAGSIMGTPAYMPPEQAAGKLEDVDERSDIYSLGAILYEMMTLTPPVGRGGDVMSIVMRVIDGKIDPPEKRAPDRAKAGWIPPELSAIAMKALAKKRGDRYQTVTELQRDIQLFQEGRSVSAKQDSTLEMFKKLVKRNKGASAGIGLTLLVLLGSLVFIGIAWWQTDQARRETDKAYSAYKDEQEQRKRQQRESVPALVGAARFSSEVLDLDGALKQLDLALSYDPDHPPAHLLMAQVKAAQLDFTAAAQALGRYRTLRPDDAEAEKMARLCQDVRPNDGERLLLVAEALLRQKALGPSNRVIEEIGKIGQERSKLLPLLQQRLDAAWKGTGSLLTISKTGGLSLNLADRTQVRDLKPLRGMPLNELDLRDLKEITDLTPLKGMPLDRLILYGNPVHDLSPLQGMQLTHFHAHACPKINDLSPLKGMPLTYVNLTFSGVHDLSPLKGMQLSYLALSWCTLVRDLGPLRGMPLTELHLTSCKATDLTPLKGMPLLLLSIENTDFRDLTPLKEMPLTTFEFSSSTAFLKPRAENMEILRNMPSLTRINGMTAAQFWKEFDAKKAGK